MIDINSIGFDLDPTNVPIFLLDWEITKLCNLDCSYCGVDTPNGGHENDTKHPDKTECMASVDFMYEYVDMYMKYKKATQRKVVLNIYGGECLFHPDIVEILTYSRQQHKKYENNWHLTINCTTNGIVGKKRWAEIVPLIDQFSISYHAENLPKQKQQYLDNILYLKEQNKRFNCVVMMHNDPKMFEDSESVVNFCIENNIKYVAKPLDNVGEVWDYTQAQFDKLKNLWTSKVNFIKQADYKKLINNLGDTEKVNSLSEGRTCCGGRRLSINGDLKSSLSYVPKQNFKGWYCSVNWFFLNVQQLSKQVFTNKDCRTSTTGRVEPLGYLTDTQQILDTLKQQLETNTMPIIQCKKTICVCGFCAPKAQDKNDFLDLVKRHVPNSVFNIESLEKTQTIS